MSERDFAAWRRDSSAWRREVGTELQGIRVGVSSIHRRLDAVGAGHTEQTARLTTLDGRVAAHDDQITAINNRVSAVEAAMFRGGQGGAAPRPAVAPAAVVRRAPVTAGSYKVRETPNGPLIMLDRLPLYKVTRIYYAFHGRVHSVAGRMTAERANEAVLGAGVRKDRVPHAQGSAPGTYRTLEWAKFVSYYNRRRRMADLPTM